MEGGDDPVATIIEMLKEREGNHGQRAGLEYSEFKKSPSEVPCLSP
jgi:hypothetical protein